MKLFIIGNGFDIAHGLPTQYSEFRDYLEEIDFDFLIKLEAAYGFVTESRKDLVNNLLWRDFESNLSSINEEEIVDGALSIDMGLEGGDVDIEDTLNTYWEEEYKYIQNLNDYVKSWVQEIDINVLPKTTKIRRNLKDLFLTFNYTLVLERVYKIDSEQILHIHGSLNNDKDYEPVIGHGNAEIIERTKASAVEASENFWEKESSIYNALTDYLERTRKDVPFYLCYNNEFFLKLHSVDQVNVVGHSWGDVDLPYFKKVLQNVGQNTIWNIYYYKDKEEKEYQENALSVGIKRENIKMINTKKFYNKI